MSMALSSHAGGERWQVLRLLVARKTVLLSLLVLIVLVGAALLAPWISPYDPFKLSIVNRLEAAQRGTLVRQPTTSAATCSAASSTAGGCR